MERKIVLLCIPYAGATANCYNDWKSKLPQYVELHTIELAGHGKRFNESLYQNFTEVIEDLYISILPVIHNRVYCLFGHSMGCLLAYELVHLLQQRNCNMPRHLFFSGNIPPFSINRKLNISTLSDQKLADLLLQLGGIPEGLIRHQEYMKLFLPIIRNDFLLIDNYQYRQLLVPAPFTVLYADEDKWNPLSDMFKWAELATQECEMKMFKGNHFFVHSCADEVLKLIYNKINDIDMALRI